MTSTTTKPSTPTTTPAPWTRQQFRDLARDLGHARLFLAAGNKADVSRLVNQVQARLNTMASVAPTDPTDTTPTPATTTQLDRGRALVELAAAAELLQQADDFGVVNYQGARDHVLAARDTLLTELVADRLPAPTQVA